MEPFIQGITVSIDIADKEYGNGSSGFMSIKGQYPEPGMPMECLEDVIDQGLDMYFAAWKTMLASRYASGAVDGETFKKHIAAGTHKLEKVKHFLRKEVAATHE
jgi:hypothetical protein